jgi:hypothetical protein
MALGEYCLFEIDEHGTWHPLFARPRANTFLYTWGHIAARCVGQGDRSYRVSTMYLEFQNGGVAGAIAAPAFLPEDNVEYYNGLASSPDRDYLRIPIEATPTIVVAPGYEGYLPPDRGNRVVFAAQTGGSAGVHGKPFSDGAGSVVFGIALVATPVLADATADIILARGYYGAGDQVIKTARQLGAIYRVTFGEDLA